MEWTPPDESERAWFTAALVSARHLPEQALLNLGPAAVVPLVAELDEDSYVTVYSAARMLGEIGDARAVEPLIATLTHPTEDVQREAAKALARIGDPRAIEPLATALDNSRDPIAVAEALARLGDTRGADKLVLLCQSEQHVSDAVSALGDTLENFAHAVSPDALAAITSLAPVRQIRWLTDVAGCAYDSRTDSVDVSNVRQLARQELIRRGLEA